MLSGRVKGLSARLDYMIESLEDEALSDQSTQSELTQPELTPGELPATSTSLAGCLASELRSAQTDLENLYLESSNALNSLISELSGLTFEYQTARDELLTLKTENVTMRNRIESLETSHNQDQDRIESLETSHNQDQDRIESLENSHNQDQDRIESLETSHNQDQDRIESLENSLASVLKDGKHSNKEIFELESALTAAADARDLAQYEVFITLTVPPTNHY